MIPFYSFSLPRNSNRFYIRLLFRSLSHILIEEVFFAKAFFFCP